MKRQLFFVLASMGLSSLNLNAQSDSLRVEQLEEVTISAVRASEKAPVAQVTLSKKDIQAVYQGQDGAFLLERLSPAILSYSESGTNFGNYGQMRLRGIDQSRINITLNGVPLNDMIDQGVFFSNFVDFGNSIESVQVQRGVGTSSNGVASYAGSVNFESVSLTRSKPSAELQLTGGSFNSQRASVEAHTGLMENRTAFYARMSHMSSDGYRDNSSTLSNSLFFSGGYFGEKHALKLTGFAGRSENGLAYIPVSLADIQQDPRTNYLEENDIDDFGQWLFQLQHTWRIGDKTNLVSTVYYGGAGGDFPSGFRDSTGTLTQYNFPLYNDHLGAMTNFNHQTPVGNFNIGLHAYRFWRENAQFVVPDRSNPYNQEFSEKDEIAGFIKWEKAWGDLKLFADLQARNVNLRIGGDASYLGELPNIPQRDYFFLNPKLGLTYDLKENWQLYASYGRSGREPRRADIVGFEVNSGNLSDARDASTVEAEYVDDIELGTRFQNQSWAFDFNLYYMNFQNEIAPIGAYIPQYFYQIYLNQAPSYRAGAELMASYSFWQDRIKLSAQMAYLNANIESFSPAGVDVIYTDITPILSPEWNGRFAIDYQVVEKLSLGFNARYLSEQLMELSNDPSLTVPSSFILGASANYNFYKEHSLSLQLNNLSNELYYTYGAPDDNFGPAYLVQAPFNLYATLRLVF